MKSSPRAVSPAASAAEVVATFRAAARAAQGNTAPSLDAARRRGPAGALASLLLPLTGLLAAPLLAIGLTASEMAVAKPAQGALAVQALLTLPGAPVAVAKCERAHGDKAAAPVGEATTPTVRSDAPRAEARRFAPCAPVLNWVAPSFSAPSAF